MSFLEKSSKENALKIIVLVTRLLDINFKTVTYWLKALAT